MKKIIMKQNSKIYVAGHRGLVGSAIVRQLEAEGYSNFVFRTHKELDLVNQIQVNDFFAAEKPDFVFLAAAKVGGIHANNEYPAEFIYKNMMMEATNEPIMEQKLKDKMNVQYDT